MTNVIIALDDEINGLEEELARDPQYIKLQAVKRVRALYDVVTDEVGFPSIYPMSGVSLNAINETRKLISHSAKPILTREILDHLEGLGIKLGGASAQATLASILSRTTYFESKGGRVGWVLKSVGVGHG